MPHPTTPPVGAQEPVLGVEINDGIAILTLNRPAKLNSLDPELVCRLADAWEQVAADPAVRVVIVTGSGDRAVCTGADLGRLIPLFTGARPAQDEWDQRLQAEPRLLDKALLRRTDYMVPVIAAVRGFALAGGMELMLGTDLRIAADDSEFGLTDVTRGIIPTFRLDLAVVAGHPRRTDGAADRGADAGDPLGQCRRAVRHRRHRIAADGWVTPCRSEA